MSDEQPPEVAPPVDEQMTIAEKNMLTLAFDQDQPLRESFAAVERILANRLAQREVELRSSIAAEIEAQRDAEMPKAAPNPTIIGPSTRHRHAFDVTDADADRAGETLGYCEGCRRWFVWAYFDLAGRGGYGWLPVRWWHRKRRARIARGGDS